eukprot:scaffold34114_cov41-Tisochrysis_lutea.AAC.5
MSSATSLTSLDAILRGTPVAARAGASLPTSAYSLSPAGGYQWIWAHRKAHLPLSRGNARRGRGGAHQ